MAEPYANLGDAARPAASTTPSSTAAVRLACYACKRRKVKCNRQLPICSLCHKLNVACVYPRQAEKPGPKPTGPLQGTKRRRLDPPPNDLTGFGQDVSLSAAEQLASVDHARRDSAASSPSRYSATQDGSLSRGDIHPPEGEPGSMSSSTIDRPSTSHPASAPTFSRIMYPSHEAQTRPQSPSTVYTSPGHQDGGAVGITVQSVCGALQIPRTAYDMLMESYFTNMTAFSLFRPGSIEPKFAMMQHHSDSEALVAAMFSVSARHCCNETVGQVGYCPSPSYFAQIASSKLDESVDRYGDMRPPFWLLQAGVLVTFYQLTLRVRSRSWKKLGDCIRYAYDMNLHIVDANHEPTSTTNNGKANMQRWALLEERRRAWWAVWEMDVFASTIRRLPTAIDGSQNFTMLPVPDSCWFNNTYQESCFLAEDCSLRWKHLAQSGNQSAKAWFIVVNSLMRNTQRIVYPAGSAMQSSLNDKNAEANQEELNIMANCLSCTIISLPASLSYQGETLDFRPKASPLDHVNPRQDHADKYALHLMTQLCRFMIYHHKICARAPWLAQQQKGPPDGADAGPTIAQQANCEWSNYMNASEEIVRVVRNSSRDHYRYLSPFLANTLWFAAAAQCACKVFGPPSFNKRLTSSNLDLLKLTIGRFISFWGGGMENLEGKLARIETGLQNLMARPHGNGHDAAGDGSEQPPREAQPTSTAQSNVDDMARISTVLQVPIDPRLAPYSMPGTEQLLVVPGVAPSGWTDPRWPSVVPDIMSDFTQPFAMPGQNFYPADPLDFSSFGLEELLMANMDPHI